MLSLSRRERRRDLAGPRRPTAATARNQLGLSAIAVGVIAVGGCGGQDDPGAVRSTMTTLARATASQDYATLCHSVLAPALVSQVEQLGLACEDALRRGLGGVRQPQLVVRSISIRGAAALVAVHSSAANQQPSDDTVKLIKVNGAWRVSSLTGSSSPAVKP